MTYMLGWAAFIIAAGIFIDLAFNDGDALSSIFRKSSDSKEDTIKRLLEEIDRLRDELEYDQDDNERTTINNKIQDRKSVLENITKNDQHF